MQMISLLIQLITCMNLILPEILNLIQTYRLWIDNKNKRLQEAQKEEELAKETAIKNRQREESANIRAFNIGMELAWKTRKDQILGYLSRGYNESLSTEEKEEAFARIILLTDEVNNREVNNILFHENSMLETKAIKIVALMRNTNRITKINEL